VADLQAQVPQDIQQEFDDLLGVRRRFVGEQKQQIDVGLGGQLGPAVAADRHDRELLALGRVRDRKQGPERDPVQRPDDRIDQPGIAGHGGCAVLARQKARLDLGPAALQHRLQLLDQRRLGILSAALLDRRVEQGIERYRIDDAFGMGQMRHPAMSTRDPARRNRCVGDNRLLPSETDVRTRQGAHGGQGFRNGLIKSECEHGGRRYEVPKPQGGSANCH